MENEIKVGDWIRDKNGLIIKVNEIQDYSEDDDIWYEEEILKGTWKSMVVKHSPNLIDLIQCGDYVNGEQITDIWNGNRVSSIKSNFNEEDIKTIVTKEQFESVSYKAKKNVIKHIKSH